MPTTRGQPENQSVISHLCKSQRIILVSGRQKTGVQRSCRQAGTVLRVLQHKFTEATTKSVPEQFPTEHPSECITVLGKA